MKFNSRRRSAARFHVLFIFVIAAIVFGCSTLSKKQGKNILVKDCGDFCATISKCAARAKHPRMGPKLCALARCETGSKCTGDIASLNGLYFGAFQFSRQTWNSRCPGVFEKFKMSECSGDDAIYDVCCATVCSAAIIADGGSKNWPVCRHKAGL